MANEILKLVKIMSEQECKRDEQLKGAALAAYTTFTVVANDLKQAARCCE